MNPSDPGKETHLPLVKTEESHKEINFDDPEHRLLTCPKCGHLISGNDINIEKTIAQCSNCHHVFGFSHDSKIGLVPELIPPEGVEVLKLRSELDLRLDWKKTTPKGGKAFLMMFTFFWNIILLPFVLISIFSGNWGILLFLTLHLAVGLGLIYYLAGIFLNKSSINLSRRKLKVRTMPIPFPFMKSGEYELSDIKQFYVSKYTASTSNGVPNYAYALYAILKNGDKVSLLRGMNRETQHYMEQEIETYLGITNEFVKGEDRWNEED